MKNIIFLLIFGSCMANELFDQIADLYDTYGGEKYMIGEEITQKQHALQAAFLAFKDHQSEEMIVALLLHDIGQIVQKKSLGEKSFLDFSHDEIGYDWLKKNHFSDFVCDFAKYHTLAKVILCEKDPEYFNTLSWASKESFMIQKKKFLSDQKIIEEFLSHRQLDALLECRRFDDLAKESELDEKKGLLDFTFYKDMITNQIKK